MSSFSGLFVKKESAETSRLGSTIYQLGIVANEQGNVKEALRYFIDTLTLFEEFDPPGLELLREQITIIYDRIGEVAFEKWIRELVGDDEKSTELIQAIRQTALKGRAERKDPPSELS